MRRANDAVLEFFRSCVGVTRAMELMLVDVIAALIPWLAPVIPAFMAWQHMTSVLDFPGWVAGIGAAVVEFLGLSTVHTTFTFWQYNDEREARRVQNQRKARGRKKSQVRRAAGAPVWVAGITAGFYLAVIITVNVLLDDAAMIERVAKALLSLLGTVAAVTLAIRAQHARRLSDAEERKAEASRARIEARGRGAQSSTPKVEASIEVLPGSYQDFAEYHRSNGAHHTNQELADKFHVTTRTITEWRAKFKVANPQPDIQPK